MPDRGKFPLRLHVSGHWTKHIRGKDYYFGKDKDAALAEYVRVRADLEAGRPRDRNDGSGVTVGRVCAGFLLARRRRVEGGELSAGTWSLYRTLLASATSGLGAETAVDGLRPEDWAGLRAKAGETRGPRAVGQFVAVVRSAFKWAYEAELLERPVRFGPEFAPPPRRLIRLARADRGRLDLTADECRRMLAAADPQFRAMLFLGLNCGYGSSDVSRLDRSDVAREPGWLADLRPKTGTPRRCPLWPETMEAIEAAGRVRPRAVLAGDRDAVFLTRSGRRWVRITDRAGKGVSRRDSIGETFRRVARAVGVTVAGRYYTLRHTFRTVADETLDAVAVGLIMGHSDASMASAYRERVGDERLRRVVEHVRGWLLAPV